MHDLRTESFLPRIPGRHEVGLVFGRFLKRSVKRLSIILILIYAGGCQLTLSEKAQYKFAADSLVEYTLLRYETKSDRAAARGDTKKAERYLKRAEDLAMIRDALIWYWDDRKLEDITKAFDIAIAKADNDNDKKMLIYLKGRVDKYIALVQKAEG